MSKSVSEASKPEFSRIYGKLRVLFDFVRIVRNWYVLFLVSLRLVRSDLVVYNLRERVEIACRNDTTFQHLSDCYSVVENWCRIDKEVIEKIKGAQVAVDVGAHIGAFSLRLALQVPRVLAIEPLNDNFRVLQRNIDSNLLQNVVAVAAALGGSDSRRELYVGRAGSTSGFYWKRQLTQETDTMTLKTFFDKLGVERVDFLKMDCEGAEYEILMGSPPDYLRRIKFLYIELHMIDSLPSSSHSLLDYLRRNDFAVSLSTDGAHVIAERKGP